MQPQPGSVILLAEARHAELQAEVARERFSRPAVIQRSPSMSIVAVARRRLGTILSGLRMTIHDASAADERRRAHV